MMIEVLKSKIHCARVTEANLNYMGSITIDEDLLDAANMIAGEKVYIADNNNIIRLHLTCRSTIQANLARTAFTFDNVGFKALTVIVIGNIHFLTRNHVCSVQQILINRDATHVV